VKQEGSRSVLDDEGLKTRITVTCPPSPPGTEEVTYKFDFAGTSAKNGTMVTFAHPQSTQRARSRPNTNPRIGNNSGYTKLLSRLCLFFVLFFSFPSSGFRSPAGGAANYFLCYIDITL
jgi:hypothetical protein